MKPGQLSECGVCGTTEERLLLHNVRHRGTYRCLCTACVLNNFPGSFCPICFDVFDELPPPLQERVMCLKCPSISHLACVGFDDVSPRYECAPCRNPNFAFFNVNLSSVDNRINVAGGESASAPVEIRRGFNKDSAKKLLAAAKIAYISMSKAAAAARAHAEMSLKEATLAKKKAREALEHVAYLVYEENEKNNNYGKVVKGSVPIAEQLKIKPGVDALLPTQNRAQNKVGAVGVDKPRGFQATAIVCQPPKIGISFEGNGKQQPRNVQREMYRNGLSQVYPSGGKSQHQQSSRHVK